MGYDKKLKQKFPELDIAYFDTIDSTNAEAKRCVLSGKVKKNLFIAEAQSRGRGRMGRSFYSPPSTGLYLSFAYACRDITPSSLSVTSQSAVAVATAVEALTPFSCNIKWVNDIYLGGKKIAGILAESLIYDIAYIIVGIGVNLSTTEFPDELAEKAASINYPPLTAEALAEKICENMLFYIDNPDDKAYLESYRAHSNTINKKVTYTKNNVTFHGTAVSFTDEAHLVIKRDDGSTDILNSGEISLTERD